MNSPQLGTTLLGYHLDAQDDGSDMLGPAYLAPPSGGFHDWRFGRDGVPHPATCGTCGRKLDQDYVNPTFQVRRRGMDVCVTGDGYTLVSERFRSLCERQQWHGARFLPLPADDEFFVLRVAPVLLFDAERRRTRLEQLCPGCGRYYCVVGATPAFLKDVLTPLRRLDAITERVPPIGSGVRVRPRAASVDSSRRRDRQSVAYV